MNSDGSVGRQFEEAILRDAGLRDGPQGSQSAKGASHETPDDPNVSENGQLATNATETQTTEALEQRTRAAVMDDLITGAEMSVKNYKPDHFLIGPKLLPVGGRMLITAETGTGKSALALHIAACIITGKPLFGLLRAKKDADYGKPYFPIIAPTNVLNIDFELPEHIRWTERLAPLCNQFGTDFLKEIYFPKRPSELRLDPGDGFTKLERLVCDLKPGVTIIDPLSSTHSVDENTNALKQPLNRIDQLIDKTDTTVILIHHASAKKTRNALGDTIEKSAKERPRGHTCLLDWADVHLRLETLSAKNRRGYEEEEEASEAVTLDLEFSKTRYCQTPRRHKIEAHIGDMYFGRMRFAPPAKNNGNKGGAATTLK